jgi:hypothetical protein
MMEGTIGVPKPKVKSEAWPLERLLEWKAGTID